jgi:hypothetical protein
MGAFKAVVTGGEGGGNYYRLKRGELLGRDHWGSMAQEKEGAASMARRHERRRRRCSTGVGREAKGRIGPKVEGKFVSL